MRVTLRRVDIDRSKLIYSPNSKNYYSFPMLYICFCFSFLFLFLLLFFWIRKNKIK
ncbi:unnamed protein product, partial [Vitis vinifera]